jgi:DNA-binding IclR family transcriptional regulator
VFRAFLAPAAPGLERVRTERMAFFAEVVEGIAALAAPVFQGSEIVATIALVGTSAAVETAVDGPMARALREAADNLSTELGFVEPDSGGRR